MKHRYIGRLIALSWAVTAILPSMVSGQETKCDPISEEKATILLEGEVTEPRFITLLIDCGMTFQLTSENRAKFKEFGISEEGLKTIEWLEQWELLGADENPMFSGDARLSMAGSWTATFSDSLINGTLRLNLVQSDDGTIRGTYSSSLGGGGTVLGTAFGSRAKLQLTQNLQNCPGINEALLEKVGESFSGRYIGFDCVGLHLQGRFSLSPGVSLTSDDSENPTMVQGSVLELGVVRTVYVFAAPENTAEKRIIESVLRRKGIPLLDEAIKADLLLLYFIFEDKPFLLAQRVILLHNTIRNVWVCPEDASYKLDPTRVADYCANEFTVAYAEAHER